MKLYTNPRSRGVRVHWTLEELGVPYDVVVLNMEKGEHGAPEYLKIHPLGQVPAFEDEGKTMIESGAICVYLADRFPEKNLGPGDQPMEYYQWCFYCFGSLEPAVMDTLLHTQWLPEDQRAPSVAERGQAALKKVLTHLDRHMQGREYLLGSRFSVADILTGGTLQWASMMLPLTAYPNLEAYVQRLNARPAHQAATRARVPS
ncbi:MAG: glutathione S-transferase family protein [Candidatus Eremiobacterota bacterium]